MKPVLFLLGSIPLVYFSRHALFNVRRHGFYRFWSWEAILWLTVNNLRRWFAHPFSAHQIVSWMLLFIAAGLAAAGFLYLVRRGKPHESRTDQALMKFERTTELITTGLYRFIRHPLYSSLIFLTWGIFFKHPVLEFRPVAIFSTACLIMTATIEERENTEYFGEQYSEYRKRSKMFIPFLF